VFTANAFIQYYAECQTTSTTLEAQKQVVTKRKKNIESKKKKL
jgi:hypothetical protein